MGLKAGIFLPHLGVADRDLLRDFVRQAEALGFDSVWGGDHLVLPHASRGVYPYAEDGRYGLGPTSPILELWTTLSFVAAWTERLRVGSAVCVLPYRHPAVTAKMVATLDFLSGGRVEFGVGVGWLPEELESLGAEPDRRGAVVDEQLEIIRRLWTGETVTFEGRFYRLTGVGLEPKPLQRPHPRIWVGGNGEVARRRAVRLGGVWFPAFFRQTLQEVADWKARLHEACTAAGRPPDAVPMAGRIHVDLRDRPDLERARKRDSVTGTAEEVAASVRAYLQAGVDYPVFMLPPCPPAELMASLDRLGRRVLPLLNDFDVPLPNPRMKDMSS